MTRAYDHLEPGTPEAAWIGSGLDDLARLDPPGADAALLVIAAHPDDESLGAGGLIATAAATGARVHVLVATDGGASHPHSPTHSPEQLTRRRRAEVTAAAARLAGAATLEFLGLPDGRLAEHGDELAAAIAGGLDGCTHVVSPWRGDQHPDHETCARAVTAGLTGRRDIQHWQYPIWAWHWAAPDNSADLPWPTLRRLDLDPAAVRAKDAALRCHVSQHAPLSPAPGDEAVLPPGILAHFQRDFETFVLDAPAPATHAAYFDSLYAAADDPWDLAGRFYETRKRSLALASLPRARFARAFEPGCATGRLTAELAQRCDEVLAWDGAAAAVRQTREYVPDPHVSVEHRRIPGDWPTGPFDLIVLSEVAYYCPDLGVLTDRVAGSLSDDGVLLACHWNHHAPDHPHTAHQTHAALDEIGLRPLVRHREADFVLDVWSVFDASVAEREGILDPGGVPVIRSVGVIVPASDEQAAVGACLDALTIARTRLRWSTTRDITVRIVVVLDSCVDETATIVRRTRGVESLVCTSRSVGAARALGARHLLTDAVVAPRELWLANTDADSTVPRDWLAVQVEEAERGAHLVVGTVLPDVGLPAGAERAWFDRHRLRDGHPYVHGANLGVRADVYAGLGGWPPSATGEDVAFVARAASAGHLRIARKANIPVRTSVRADGRAPHGFAAYLRGLEAPAGELAV